MGTNKFAFEKLDVWNKAKDFTVILYEITANFPRSELFGIVSQLRRASVSICSNIAEGSSRTSRKEQKRFYTIAYSSAIETVNQIILCRELGYIQTSTYRNLRKEIEHITSMINRLHKSIK